MSSTTTNTAGRNDSKADTVGMSFLDSVPRKLVTVYLPLVIFVIVLLFPFYWMAITAIKPDFEMYDYAKFSPFWVHSPTLANIDKLLFHTEYPQWLMITMGVATAATFLSLFASVLAA